MRICIFGAGAVGGHPAANLAAAGHEVSALARGANLEGIRSHGVALREGERTIAGPVRAIDRASELGPQDVVFVTAKATALASLEDAVLSLGHRDSVFVQNGIPWWYARGIEAPALEQLALTARLAPCKGLYSTP